MLRQIALVSTTRDAPLSEVAQTAAALQTQVSRDLGQFWGAQACVSAFGSLSDIPLGYWPIVVSDTMPEPGRRECISTAMAIPIASSNAGPPGR